MLADCIDLSVFKIIKVEEKSFFSVPLQIISRYSLMRLTENEYFQVFADEINLRNSTTMHRGYKPKLQFAGLFCHSTNSHMESRHNEQASQKMTSSLSSRATARLVCIVIGRTRACSKCCNDYFGFISKIPAKVGCLLIGFCLVIVGSFSFK